uniref:Gustatory receptor n=1 Tax=Anopheles dirus TaxID=7168 RepID=A0A182NZ27_9DIPT
MAARGVLTLLEKWCLWLLMFCGLLAFRFDVSSNRFVQSSAYYWASILLTTAFMFVSPFIYWCSITLVMHPKSLVNVYMIAIQFMFMYVVVIVSRIKAITNRQELCQLLNSLLAVREQALQGSGATGYDHSLSRRLWMKLVVFDFGMLVVSASFFRTFIDLNLTFFYSLIGFMNLMLVSSMNVAINFLIFVLYNAVNIFRLVNERCNALVYGSKVSKDTVRLYLMHTETTLIIQRIVELLSIPILLLSVWFFFIIVFSVFYMYTSLVQDIKSGSVDAVRNVMNPFTFFISEVGQVYFMVSASAMFSDRARQIIAHLTPYTGRITDGPGDQTVEILTIEYLNRDYSIGVKGLYTIDYTMLFSIAASTTSYLIILVQYYLQE